MDRRPTFFCSMCLCLALAACKPTAQSAAPDAAPAPSPSPPPAPSASASAPATPEDAARALAEADLAAAVARTPLPALPAGTDVGIVCCMQTGIAGAPAIASVSLFLPRPGDAPGAARPTVGLGAGYQIDLREPKIVGQADLSPVRANVTTIAKEATAAFALAHDKLVTLPRYKGWPKPLSYATSLIRTPGSGAHAWAVYFRAADDDIDVSIDLDDKSVKAIHAGPEHTPLPL